MSSYYDEDDDLDIRVRHRHRRRSPRRFVYYAADEGYYRRRSREEAPKLTLRSRSKGYIRKIVKSEDPPAAVTEDALAPEGLDILHDHIFEDAETTRGPSTQVEYVSPALLIR